MRHDKISYNDYKAVHLDHIPDKNILGTLQLLFPEEALFMNNEDLVTEEMWDIFDAYVRQVSDSQIGSKVKTSELTKEQQEAIDNNPCTIIPKKRVG